VVAGSEGVVEEGYGALAVLLKVVVGPEVDRVWRSMVSSSRKKRQPVKSPATVVIGSSKEGVLDEEETTMVLWAG
jgi:hypothetical protein